MKLPHTKKKERKKGTMLGKKQKGMVCFLELDKNLVKDEKWWNSRLFSDEAQETQREG